MNTHTAFLLAAFAALATACGVTEVRDSPDSDPVDGTEDAGGATPGPDVLDVETGSAGCPWVGDLDLDDDAMREAFELSGCNVVHGDVLFVGSARDAIPATGLHRVVGNVIVSCNENLRSLDGLASLEELLGTDRPARGGRLPNIAEFDVTASAAHDIDLGGVLLIGTVEEPPSGCGNEQLVDLSGLDSLHTVDQVIASWNSGLQSLAGAEAIEFTGFVLFQSNPRLVSIDHFDSLTTIWHGLRIADNGCLSDAAAREFLDSYRDRGGQIAPEQFLFLRNGEDCPAAEGSSPGP